MAAQKIVIALTVILMLAGCITATKSQTPQTKADCPAGTHFIKVDGVNCGADTITNGNSTCATNNWCKRNDTNCADYDAATNSCKECEWGYEKKKEGTEYYCSEKTAYSIFIWVGVGLASLLIFCVCLCVGPALCCAIDIFECLCGILTCFCD
jgi:hypothetical protein